jgi:retron-type reverse transcriptase
VEKILISLTPTSISKLIINLLFLFKVGSVLCNLKNLKANKSTGLDAIPAKILKLAAHIIAPSLTYIFNLSLIQSGIYVNNWKQARVTPIFKSEDKSKCENYRPISILSIVSKVFEKEVFRQMYTYMNESNLSKYQSGFQPQHSTLSALIKICDEILNNMDKEKINCIVFLDIWKAFDSINHNILLSKMRSNFGISGNELLWFESYLMNREQQCVANGILSSVGKLKCGVPQGSILGPLLFLLYINDLPQCLQKTTPGLYADDMEIYASSHNVNDLIDNINYDLNIVMQWMENNKLQIHPKKFKCMFIASPYKIKNIPQGIPILINVPVPRLNCYKCLGVTLEEKLNWVFHIDMIIKKVNAGIEIIKLMKTCVPQEFLQTVYNALIQPYFDYWCQLWDTCGIVLKEKLQKCQSRAARVITGASYDIRLADVLATLGWQTLDNRRKYLKSIL